MSFCSATKYFLDTQMLWVDHLAVNKKVFNQIMFFYKLSGYRMSADEAYLIIRGLRTLDTRLKQHFENTKNNKFFEKTKKNKRNSLSHINPQVKIINFGKILFWSNRFIFNSN